MRRLIYVFVLMLFSTLAISQNVKIVFNDTYVEEDPDFDGQYLAMNDSRIGGPDLREDSKGRVTGRWVDFHENGQLKEYGKYIKGEKNGTWFYFNEDGVKISEATYFMGEKDGRWLVWDKYGNLRYEMFYDMGERTGEWKEWDYTGRIVSIKSYQE